ncbi:radical SAM protein [Fulvivirga sp. M361]|uniref:radical SAM protein n=1 Tax=Fulvivirga sp. M361 TaxID=2594266 RepID=UPI00117B1BDE|nr:radical SAM protein [Fulvivirga sp. M361]TRX59418.1 radical SAM protein [Fulvivirga sp. M361]
MPTFLFDSVVFGPIKSRRLGDSLGLNLLSTTAKICNLDCIYCECGWSNNHADKDKFVNQKTLKIVLEKILTRLVKCGRTLDYITFAGNGEPTLHPHFEEIVDDVVALRDEWVPKAKIAVLSNATTLKKASVMRGLKKVDSRILKLDVGSDEYFQLINKPIGEISLDELCHDLQEAFNGDFCIQSMFIKGEINGRLVDNTTPEEVRQWIEKLAVIKPKEVMLYSIDRDTALSSLTKVSEEELLAIADKVRTLGLATSVTG